MGRTVIRFNDLTLGYDRHPAVHHLDGSIEAGAMLAVVGPNGGGKSTLLKAIAGALKPLDGQIERLERMAWLPQSADIDRSFPITVFDLVAMGLIPSRGLMGRIGRKDSAAIEQALAAVGLIGFEDRIIGTLSGGQMQRVLFARLLLQDAPILLLDEPLTALDSATAVDLIALIRQWHQEGRTILAVLHDMALVERIFPETLLLAREPIAWGATRDVLTPANLQAARQMVEAHDPFADYCARVA
jgi:zinc/manganese transport system ATP-binding protein